MKILEDEREKLFANMQRGEAQKCPCCDQFCKIYKRKITRTSFRNLATLYKMGGMYEYKHYKDFAPNNGGDFAKLLGWGLIKKKPHTEGADDKKSSGYWMVTERGEQFLRGLLSVDERIHIYNNDFIGFSGRQVFATDIDSDFSYNELMAA